MLLGKFFLPYTLLLVFCPSLGERVKDCAGLEISASATDADFGAYHFGIPVFLAKRGAEAGAELTPIFSPNAAHSSSAGLWLEGPEVY